MLKLTKKADYGLIAMRHLAMARPTRSASAKEISERYGIPLPLLAKVLQRLAREGLLTAVHGTNGGYKLARDPREISALEVIRSIDGPVILTSCFEHDGCDHTGTCSVREPLRKIHGGILQLLAGITISEMGEEAGETVAISVRGNA
jgi:Rrf2 family protein